MTRASFVSAATLVVEWIALGALVGALSGLASALFLYLLDVATTFRTEHEAIVFTLPIAGLGIGWLYERYGASIRGGSNLVLERAHSGGETLPLRMAPMVLLGTVATHLFGGSAGREGTAVQMGASLADALAARLPPNEARRRLMIAAGIAGGFGSVFGTPIAGMVFGLEVIVLGRIEHHAMLPALTAALVGDQVTRAILGALGHAHTDYPTIPEVALSFELALEWVLFAAIVAAVTVAFVELTKAIKERLEVRVKSLPLRMALGGATVVLLFQLLGTSDHLGLGVPTIVRAFEDPTVPAWYFAAKLLLTAVTIGAGFLGGEVTPLFFVGATLGGLFARTFGLPLELGAGVGLAAVFAAASNAPLALSIMALELLGSGAWPHAIIVCALAYVMAGHRGIYPSQHVVRTKWGAALAAPRPLRELGDQNTKG